MEDETLACGTGAVASAIITVFQMQKLPHGNYRVKVDTQSKETLSVYFNIKKNKINNVCLNGKAKIVYHAAIYV